MRPGTRRAPRRWWFGGEVVGGRPPVVSHAAIADDHGLVGWLVGVEIYGFCLAEGVPATPEDTAALARRIGYLRATIFGDFWDFIADLAKADTAYTNLELRPHTDGTYAFRRPVVEAVQRLDFGGKGGGKNPGGGFWNCEGVGGGGSGG